MTHPLTNVVRENVRQIVAEHGVDPQDMSESILIRDGYYCGRRFQLDGLQAVWFVEENELKVYNADGSLLLVTEASAPYVAPAIRRAA